MVIYERSWIVSNKNEKKNFGATFPRFDTEQRGESDFSVEVDLQDNRVAMLTDGTLMIHNTVDADKGTYQCVARTPNQEIRTNKVQLTYSRGNHEQTHK